MPKLSCLQEERSEYQAKLPDLLKESLCDLKCLEGEKTGSVADEAALAKEFPNTFGQKVLGFERGGGNINRKALRVAVVLSGGPAPGGHNVILGLFDGLKKLNPHTTLFGFKKGPGGIVDGDVLEITDDLVKDYRNTGGFDLIMSGRTKIESPEQFASCLKNCSELDLDALLVIGGDDSNTNAAVLAEFFLASGSKTLVIGAPKTIDGDMKNDQIEASFGFDTACKTYSELVGNIARDAVSSVKYWHFIRLMGRSASHIALEVGIQTQVNLVLVGEEVEKEELTLADVVEKMVDVVLTRSRSHKDYGVVIVPEGIIEFIPEIGRLITNLNELLAHNKDSFESCENDDDKVNFIITSLQGESLSLYQSLPKNIQLQLVAKRDPHGNVQVSLIETEKLLSKMIAERLEVLKGSGDYHGSFAALHHFFGYEGRCAAPSNFDADYAYGLGTVASLLIGYGKRGYVACLQDLHKPVSEWRPCGIPLTSMMNMERRHGKDKPVIKKALVELDGAPFKFYVSKREEWAMNDCFIYPGPIQYFGPSKLCDRQPLSLLLEKGL